MHDDDIRRSLLPPSHEDEIMERSVLTQVLLLHPAQLSILELALRVETDLRSCEQDAVERAVRELSRDGRSPVIADASRRAGRLCALTSCLGVSPRNGSAFSGFSGAGAQATGRLRGCLLAWRAPHPASASEKPLKPKPKPASKSSEHQTSKRDLGPKADKTARVPSKGQQPNRHVPPFQPPPQLHDTLGTPPFSGVRAMQRTGSLDSPIEMPSARIKLDPQATEAIARRVVELLERRGLQRRELVDAAELARRLGIERSWVYTHAIELGAVKLGNGAKPRLRFDPEIAARVLRKVDGKPAADPPARSGKRASQPRGSKGKAELLPIRGPGENLPPSVA